MCVNALANTFGWTASAHDYQTFLLTPELVYMRRRALCACAWAVVMLFFFLPLTINSGNNLSIPRS